MFVIKADGRKERFNKFKIIRSLKRVGISHAQAEQIVKNVRPQLKGTVHSDEIFRQVVEHLKKQPDTSCISRYNLRRSVMHLGPAGYPFEKYVARILADLGYETKTNQIIQGRCVSHEIDVLARKNNNHFIIECKYHNTRGARSDVKVALYCWARFMDIKARWEKMREHRDEIHNEWLITNTRFTSEAIAYGQCMGMKITGWGYPQEESLETLIETTRAYPVSIFPHLGTPADYAKLYAAHIILAKDLLKYTVKQIKVKTGLKESLIALLQAEAKKLCS